MKVINRFSFKSFVACLLIGMMGVFCTSCARDTVMSKLFTLTNAKTAQGDLVMNRDASSLYSLVTSQKQLTNIFTVYNH